MNVNIFSPINNDTYESMFSFCSKRGRWLVWNGLKGKLDQYETKNIFLNVALVIYSLGVQLSLLTQTICVLILFYLHVQCRFYWLRICYPDECFKIRCDNFLCCHGRQVLNAQRIPL